MGGAVLSGATLLKRNATGSWHGIHVVDQGGATGFVYPSEFNPSDQLIAYTGVGGSYASAATFADTTNWMIVGFTWDGTGSANAWKWRYKIGAGAWASENETVGGTGAGVAGSGYRHIIGNEPALGDDADFDWVCTGLIKSNLAQVTFESLDMSAISTWDAVFTGAGAWLLDGQAIGSRTDRTGNGGNEVGRSASVSLVSDPPGFNWGGGGGVVVKQLGALGVG